jgi:coenzyme PQQ synthesis protein D (PqqD)
MDSIDMDWTEAFPLRRSVPWRTLDTEALVVDVKSGLLYPLNSVGARIWELCDGARSVEEIVGVVAGEFAAPEPTIRADTVEFIERLADAKLVSIERRRKGESR